MNSLVALRTYTAHMLTARVHTANKRFQLRRSCAAQAPGPVRAQGSERASARLPGGRPRGAAPHREERRGERESSRVSTTGAALLIVRLGGCNGSCLWPCTACAPADDCRHPCSGCSVLHRRITSSAADAAAVHSFAVAWSATPVVLHRLSNCILDVRDAANAMAVRQHRGCQH